MFSCDFNTVGNGDRSLRWYVESLERDIVGVGRGRLPSRVPDALIQHRGSREGHGQVPALGDPCEVQWKLGPILERAELWAVRVGINRIRLLQRTGEALLEQIQVAMWGINA